MSDQKSYWDTQFSEHGCVWGKTHSKSAEIAASLFRKHKVRKILIPGSGYGRNSKLFSSEGFDVTGIEISGEACKLAADYDPAMQVYNDSFFDHDFGNSRYDAIYCFNVLHLFLEKERQRFLDRCAQVLAPRGFMFFSVVSENDEYYGQGQRIEDNTFEAKPGKILHFFTEKDLIGHFVAFKMLEVGAIEDQVSHSEYGIKSYCLRYIFSCKTAS
jgi:SAM-dependent methyltransferase